MLILSIFVPWSWLGVKISAHFDFLSGMFDLFRYFHAPCLTPINSGVEQQLEKKETRSKTQTIFLFFEIVK